MERCPNCRARYQEGNECRRCGMDLSQLLSAERAADRLLCEAMIRLAAGDARAAADSLRRAGTLRRDPLQDLLLGFARSLVRTQPSLRDPTPAGPAAATLLDVPASR